MIFNNITTFFKSHNKNHQRFWIASDYHLGHQNIITYTHRPFKTVQEMDRKIIHNHNLFVQKNDTVFFLGDLCFKSGSKRGEGIPRSTEYWLSKLNGNFIWLRGNHDKQGSTKTILHSCVIRFCGHEANLVHNPDHYNSRYKYNICGHVHDKWKFQQIDDDHYLLNVSCEMWNYSPLSFEQLWKAFEKWKVREEK